MAGNILLIALGGGAGSVLRYLCHRWMATASGNAVFPIGTMVVNLIGCLVIGLLFGWSTKYGMPEHKMAFLMTGFCGGFTTFSAFTLDAHELARQEKLGWFFLYIGASVILGLAATWLGIKLTR